MNKTTSINATIGEAIEAIEAIIGEDEKAKQQFSGVFDLLLDAQDQLTYERAARDTLKWWADTIRSAGQDGSEPLSNSIREGLQRIHNLDQLVSPHSIPAGKVVIESLDDNHSSAEVMLTNVIKTLNPGTHFLYLGVAEAEGNEH